MINENISKNINLNDNISEIYILKPEKIKYKSLNLKIKLKYIKLLALDVDGVLTDGQLYYNEHGEALKVFNTLDGHGLKKLQAAGIEIAIISGRGGAALRKRMQDLGVKHVFENVEDKHKTLIELLQNLNLKLENVAYMGDDEPDLAILNLEIGLAACPNNAHSSVVQACDILALKQGGYGAVRSVCDFILEHQNN